MIELGKIITSVEQRDAVHLAIAPVRANETLYPGQHIGFTEDGSVVGVTNKSIGIVDPFLPHKVLPGQEFWMFLYPNTVTSLRHDWTHPAFEEKPIKTQSQIWWNEFASELEMNGPDLMKATQAYLKNGEYLTLPFDTPDRVWSDQETFWHHYEVLTGTKVENHKDGFISCSC